MTDGGFDTQVEELRQSGANVRILSSHELVRWRAVTEYREGQAAWAAAQRTNGVQDVDAALAGVTRIMTRFVTP